MTALDNHIFQYTFKNVTEPVNFDYQALVFILNRLFLKVAQKPVLKAIKVQIDYPEYTGKKDEYRSSLGIWFYLSEPCWLGIVTEYTDAASLHWANGSTIVLPKQLNFFQHSINS